MWVESLQQIQQMLNWWISYKKNDIKILDINAKILSLHVFTNVELENFYSFENVRNSFQFNFSIIYRDSIALMLKHFFILFVVFSKLFSLSLISYKWVKIDQATRNFRKYMIKMIKNEKNLISAESTKKKNLINTFVREFERA